MKKTIILILIACNLQAQKIDDKDKHFLISSNMACGGAITLYKITDKPVKSVALSILITLAVGAAKEGLYDGALHKGVMDWRGDFVADAVGAFTGGFIAGGCIVLKKNKEQKIDDALYDMNKLSYEDLERLEKLKAVTTYNETICE